MTKHDKARGDHIVAVIADYTQEYGYAPSVRDIMERVGLASTAAVHHWIIKLVKQGRLARDPIARGLRVIGNDIPDGVCQRPGCGEPLPEGAERWCSRTCHAIAGHVRRWVKAAGAERLAAELWL